MFHSSPILAADLTHVDNAVYQAGSFWRALDDGIVGRYDVTMCGTSLRGQDSRRWSRCCVRCARTGSAEFGEVDP